MQRADFSYDLPPELIAQEPLPRRSDSRLLALDGVSAGIRDRVIADLPALLRSGDLLVFNDTRVVAARVTGVKPTGGAVEMLLERPAASEREALVQLRASKPIRAGSHFQTPGGAVRVIERQGELYRVELPSAVPAYFDAHGAVPLPPYIERQPDAMDRDRYQSIFARDPGAVAAPTASLHFDAALIAALAQHGVENCRITLHVGAGTFQPLRVEDPALHRMHAERVVVAADSCAAIEAARQRGSRVVAVGTTVARALEAASASGMPRPYHGDTDIFIRPGYRFGCVDALITNFHLPESTLLMLVCAFSGREAVLAAYRHAIAQRYRFFSYGDAMFLTPADGVRV